MCGIAGLAGLDRAALVGSVGVVDMVGRLRHRGPDADGTRTFGRCSLGHSRLRIIDLSPLADQPLANEDDSVWTVFNGEIYNFAELRSALRRTGHQFRSETDTEVLVHLYEEYGPGLARHLRGMFAFAIWDDPRQRLVLCRDRLGIKPLYYRIDGERLSFASEVRALVEPTAEIDAAAIHGFLRLGWIPGPGSIRSGVSELPPGHILVWERSRATISRYWPMPEPGIDDDPPEADELGAALLDSMQRHLVADVPIGLFLSSGVDSVVLARLAGRVFPGLRTYTVAFNHASDESGDAARIAAGLGLEHTVVRVGEADALAALHRFVDDMDQPTVDGLNSWIISRAVRDAGLVVALSGLGGDELFGGYSTFRHVPRLVRAGRIARLAPPLANGLVGAMGWSERLGHSRGRRALEAMVDGHPGDAYGSVRGLFSAGELARIWPASREFVDRELVAAPLEPGRSTTAQVGDLEIHNYLPFQLLRDTDCMSMAHALEVRVPLLDDSVVDVALRGQRSASGTWDKNRLIDAVDPSLRYLADRPKKTFTLPIDDWMRGRVRDMAEDAVASLSDSPLGFDRRELTNLWHGYLGGRVGWRPAWSLAVLGMWLDQHARRATPVLSS